MSHSRIFKKIILWIVTISLIASVFSVHIFAQENNNSVEKQKSSISLSTTRATIVKGKSFLLKATAYPKKGISWKSSNPKVATVSKNGLVKTKAAGSVKITASLKDGSGKKAVCHITVLQYAKTVRLNRTSAVMKKGTRLKLKATVSPADATSKKVLWRSSNPKVADISSAGHNGKETRKRCHNMQIG